MYIKNKESDVVVMSVKDYTNEEVLIKLVEAALVYHEKRRHFGSDEQFWLDEFRRLKLEVLERMEK